MLAINRQTLGMSDKPNQKALRITEAFSLINANKSEVAELIGVSQQGFGQALVNGKLGFEKVSKLAKLANLNPEWIMTGQGVKEASSSGIDRERLKECFNAVIKGAENLKIDLDEDQIINAAINLYEND